MNTPSNLARIKEIFGQALEVPESQRASFVAACCGQDSHLQGEVESLLRAHDSAAGFLERPTMSPPGRDTPDDPRPRQIGAYQVLDRLGEGGFGTVYLVEQAHPFRRLAALKVLRFGLDSTQALARFEAERQTLALMNHPSIAQIYDAGATDDRRPYFVMEVVNGLPITQYAQQRGLSTVQRLRLFFEVCQAVHHAHQKGIIHRDIKPTNVLVVDENGQGRPKVIDFGVAKASEHANLGSARLVTEDRQLIGTPEYMSPEQAGLTGIDIDTRSDVYSLGVLLYELLTGVTPFDSAALRAKSLAEMQRIIAQDDPPPPSTRAAQMAAGNPASMPAARALAGQLRGELDWIVMKCLEKDRTRRYESAAALAQDIADYLQGKPVQAGPPTRMYRMRKFVRRHRAPVVAAAVVAVAITGGLIATLISLRQVRIERDRAVAARALAEDHIAFVRDMFTSINPEHARGRQVTVRELLDIAAARTGGSFRGHPAAESAVRNTFGVAFAGIGLFDRSREQFERAMKLLVDSGQGHGPEMIELKTSLGTLEREAGRFKEAESLLRDALAESRARLGLKDRHTVVAADELAVLLARANELDEADRLRAEIEPLIDPVFGAGSQSALALRGNHAQLRHIQGRFDDAERMYRQTIDTAEHSLGASHPDTIGLKYMLAMVLRDEGRFPEALALQEQAFEYAARVFGPDHPNTLKVAQQSALMLSSNGRSAEAETRLLDTVERCRRVLGEDHPTTLYARHNLLQIRSLSGRNTQNIEAELVDLIQRMARVLGESHRDTLMFQGDLARLYLGRADYAAAEKLYSTIWPRLQQTLGAEHPYTLSVQLRLGVVMGRQGRWTDAEPLLAQAYQVERSAGMTARVWAAPAAYGNCLEQLGKFAEALPILHEAESAMKAYPKMDRVQMRSTATSLARCYQGLGQPDRAAEYTRIAAEMDASLRASTQPSPP